MIYVLDAEPKLYSLRSRKLGESVKRRNLSPEREDQLVINKGKMPAIWPGDSSCLVNDSSGLFAV